MSHDPTRSVLGPLWLVTLFPAAAVGSEQGQPPGLFSGDVGNILWTLATFLAVVFVLGKYAWPPILRALQQREEFIRDSLRQASKDRQEAEARLQEMAQRLDKARQEASAIVEEGRRDAEVVRRKIREEAHAEAAAMLERAKREIGTARDSAVKELYELTAKLSTEVAGRILRKELDAQQHERLIEESIEELSRIGAGRGD